MSCIWIAALNLNADLAVLSACNTANFDLSDFSSEVQGLTSGFALAGVPTTLATLWSVDSTAAQKIISAFYENLVTQQKPGLAHALADSKRLLLKTATDRAYAHPRFWAPFMLYGDGTFNLSTSPKTATSNKNRVDEAQR